jgi:hypothetical protein
MPPWPKGTSGNPSGLPKVRPKLNREAMIAEHTAKAMEHHKRSLTPIEVELINQIVTLKLTKPKSATSTIRIANSVNRFMRSLYGTKGKPAAAYVPLRERLLQKKIADAGLGTVTP